MENEEYASTYDQIYEGKVEIAKNLFRELGIGFAECANVFTEDELVKTFDFFNKHSEKDDDDIADNAMWVDFLEESANFLSKKSHKFLNECNG